ncbi:glycosyltransferase family 4 protein [Polynucleobacter paneuropaeus]|nr:glycosyltransferase family 4 protein [Polynucleobacter paneuropaeus]
MKVAIVHYWLVNMRGGEKVLEALCELYPDADIYTHVYDSSAISEMIKRHRIKTSFIQRLPNAVAWYQNYLPLMPLALRFLNLKQYDLVISAESGPSKGVRLSKNALFICYCHSPMRYVWDLFDEYYRSVGLFKKGMMLLCMKPLRIWDRWTAQRVDQFVANSTTVQRRIQNCYGRESIVIHPPVDLEAFQISSKADDYYLLFGQVIQYKRPDLAIEAFNASGRKLIVVGQGNMLKDLKKIAKSNIQFMGRLEDSQIQKLVSQCKALIFPGLEDFGIIPVEVMSSGRPVIAYGQGGVLDTVMDGETGIFFADQTVASLNAAIDQYENTADQFIPEIIKTSTEKFSKMQFKLKFTDLVKSLQSQSR